MVRVQMSRACIVRRCCLSVALNVSGSWMVLSSAGIVFHILVFFRVLWSIVCVRGVALLWPEPVLGM